MDKIINGKHIFEVVKEIPRDYVVWNIGRHNFPFECYIPLCQEDENYYVNTNTLKAIKVESEEKALEIMNLAIRKNLNWNDLRVLVQGNIKEVA